MAEHSTISNAKIYIEVRAIGQSETKDVFIVSKYEEAMYTFRAVIIFP